MLLYTRQVVPDSGPGWQLVTLSAPAAGDTERAAVLRVRHQLDYESSLHRAGLAFRVQVTDQVGANRQVCAGRWVHGGVCM